MTDPVDRALESLQSLPSESWRDVASVGRRRRRIRLGVVTAVVVVAITGVVVVPRLGSDGGRSPSAAPPARVIDSQHIGTASELVAAVRPLGAADPSAVTAVARAEQDLTASLLQAVPGSGNVSVSPASLALALAMLQNGARGTTASEIAAALHTSSLSATAQDAGWAGLTSAWTSAAKSAGIQLSSANSLWVQHGLPIDKQFLAALARYYASGVWQVDFGGHTSDALAAMNAWTSQHTGGRIKKLFDSLDPSTVLVLANAVYFHAAWETPFDVSDTKPAAFHTSSGATVTAQFMNSTRTFSTASTATYDAAELPYRGGRFAALAIMPRSSSLHDFVAGLDGTKLADIASTLNSTAAVALPRFTTTTVTDLMPVLHALGLHTALSASADYSGLSPSGLQLDQAIQRVYLKVGEKGTEAAAVTGLGFDASATIANPTAITFDHPFLFLIRDTKTGAVLFASKVVDPQG